MKFCFGMNVICFYSNSYCCFQVVQCFFSLSIDDFLFVWNTIRCYITSLSMWRMHHNSSWLHFKHFSFYNLAFFKKNILLGCNTLRKTYRFQKYFLEQLNITDNRRNICYISVNWLVCDGRAWHLTPSSYYTVTIAT